MAAMRLPSPTAALAGLLWITTASSALADPPAPRTFSSLLAAPPVCVPGSQIACQCAGGARGSQVCDATGIRVSACACASVDVNVNVPVPPIPRVPYVAPVDVTWQRPHRRVSHRRYSGLGFLIGGGSTLIHGTTSLVIGIERLTETRADPLGIVMIATGGTAMAVGLPLTIVGIAFLATRGLHPDQAAAEWLTEGVRLTPTPGTTFRLAPTATGLALQF